MFPMNEVIIVSCELLVIVVIYCTSYSVSGSAIGGVVLRRVPRKSVFIAPKIYRDECDDGYSRSITKKCIEIIMPDQKGWENILLARLRDIEYDYDDEEKAASTLERGKPYPIGDKPDVTLDEFAKSTVRSDESSEFLEEDITWQENQRGFDDTTSIIDDSDPTTLEEIVRDTIN